MLLIERFNKSLNYILLVYCTLFTATIFVNKYILSTLKFTYPTVFQGWQTLLASISLLVLRKCSKENINQPVHDYTILSTPKHYGISLLPSLIFHVCSLVTGSKALAVVPIPIFLGAANLPNVITHFTLKNALSRCQVISGVATFITSLGLLFLYQENGTKVSSVWLLSHIFFVSLEALHSEFIDVRTNRVRKLWYTNCFSVLILAPASLYLEEAFSALEFALTNKVKFFVCIVASGICGGMTQAISTNIEYYSSQSSAVTVAAILSLLVFTDIVLTSVSFQILIIINLISNTILCFSEKLPDRSQIEGMAV